MKYFLARTADALIVSGLIYSHLMGFGSTELFFFGLIVVMIVCMSITMFAMSSKMAVNLDEKPIHLKVISALVGISYTFALVVADHPIWAVAYILSFGVVKVMAHDKAKEVKA